MCKMSPMVAVFSAGFLIFIKSLDLHGAVKPYAFYGYTGPSTTLNDQDGKPEQSNFGLGLIQEFSQSPWSIDVGVQKITRDLSRYYVRESEPDSELIVRRSLQEKNNSSDSIGAQINVIWQRHDYHAQLGLRGQPDQSELFARRELFLQTGYLGDEGLWDLSVKAKFQAQKMPETVYQFRSQSEDYRDSPERTYLQEWILSLNRSVSETVKSGIELTHVNRSGFRPDVNGLRVQTGVAFSDRFFSRVILSELRDRRNREPKDDQGFFTMRSSEIIFSYEPIWDWIVTASYAYILESETEARRAGQNRQQKSDQYGLAIYMNGLPSQFKLNASVIRTEFGEIQRQAGGSFQWTL